MAIEQAAIGLSPVMAFGLIGVLGVGAQWLGWRLKLPAIVILLAAGVLVGPVFGILDPDRDIGPLVQPMISIAVAIILFEGGLTLSIRKLRDGAEGVRRLVFIGAPLGWLASTLALHYVAGLSWQSSTVFGGIMIVTGPTVIAPLLRTARLQERPANLLQWEAILNDPIGALFAVLAFQVVLVRQTQAGVMGEMTELTVGVLFASIVGGAVGVFIAWSFKNGKVPEYMKVPVLFAAILITFAVSDNLLHESGLLAVTVMGIVIANRDLPSYTDLRRFKEHATVLLVSGVFILLASRLKFSELAALDWRAYAFVATAILIARPAAVLLSLAFSSVPWRERLFVAFTGPRGVVLVAVAGLFGTRLVELGVEDGATIGPLAFILVSITVVLHGFTLAPLGRLLGLASRSKPGVLFVGGNPFTLGFAEQLERSEIPVTIVDTVHSHLRPARSVGIPTFTGDVLSEEAEHHLGLSSFAKVVLATDSDAYNTLVASDLAHDFGRDNVFQVTRSNADRPRHALPSTLVGREFGESKSLDEMNKLLFQGWVFRTTGLTEEYGFEQWRERRPQSMLLAVIDAQGDVRLVPADQKIEDTDVKIISLAPDSETPSPEDRRHDRAPAETAVDQSPPRG